MNRLALLALLFAACAEPNEICGNGTDDDGNGLIDCADSVCFGSDCAEDCRTDDDEDGDGFAGCADSDCVTALCEEDCTNGEDDDADGFVDCADSACFGSDCAEGCDSPVDEDGDGLIGCADPDCASPACDEQCGSPGDEDADGLVDCADPDCWVASAACEEVCDGVGDEDADGLADCADPDCFGEGCAEDCTTALDEDADGAVACLDSDCWLLDGLCGELCDNVGDEDADGLADCTDDDCFGAGCAEDCSTPLDEDGDGVAACSDSDCWGPACAEDCAAPGDEDGNGLSNCEDAACSVAPSCVEVACDDSEDNDGDGLADCDDDDCWGNGCAAGTARIQSDTTTQMTLLRSSDVDSCSGRPEILPLYDRVGAVFDTVSGTIQYTSAGGDQVQCDWSYDGVVAQHIVRGGVLSIQIDREPVAFSPACPIARPAASFLPELQFGEDGVVRTAAHEPWIAGVDLPVTFSATVRRPLAPSPYSSCAGENVRSGVRLAGVADVYEPYVAAFYDGLSYCQVNPMASGCSEASAAASCLAVRDAPGFAGASGPYFIDPDGEGGRDPWQAFCDMSRDGGGWTLVVHNDAEGPWGAWDHNLQPVADGDGEYVARRVSAGDFYADFRDLAVSEFLFETGDQTTWLIAPSTAFDSEYSDALQAVRADSTGAEDVEYRWFNRGMSNPEDPWVSIGDHVGTILYGEGGTTVHVDIKNSHRGANVFVR